MCGSMKYIARGGNVCRIQCIIVSAESVVKVAKVKSVRQRVCRVVLLQFLGRVFRHKNYVPVRT